MRTGSIRELRALVPCHGFKAPTGPTEKSIAGFVAPTGGLTRFHPSKRGPLPARARELRILGGARIDRSGPTAAYGIEDRLGQPRTAGT